MRKSNQGSLYCLWKGNKHKVLRRIQVILSFVVNDPNVIRFCSSFIRQDFIDHARREQIRVVRVDADCELRSRFVFWHGQLVQELFYSHLLLADTMGLKPMNLSDMD